MIQWLKCAPGRSLPGTIIACLDNVSPTGTESIVLATTNGTSYRIRIFGYNGATNAFTVCVTNPAPPPANDDCVGAIATGFGGPIPTRTAAVNNANASNGTDPAHTCQASSGNGIWYTYVPAVTGSYTFSTCQLDAPGSTIPDAILSIYTSAGGCAGPFTSVACDDDACGAPLGLQSVVTTSLTCGTQYYILVSGFGAVPSVGDIQFRVTPPACTVTAFNMTGGGTSCPAPGVPVGLSGSDLCFNYQLFRGATPLATLPGTGAALDFGLQTIAGTYTVVSTNSWYCQAAPLP